MIKCKCVTEWGDGSIIETDALFDPETGFVDAEMTDQNPDGGLEDEYIMFPSGKTMQICQECHEYVARSAMIPNGKCLEEVQEFKCCC